MNAHLSQYISRDQFEYFDENLKEINAKISQHSEQVDAIELKLLAINKARLLRRQKKAGLNKQGTRLKPGNSPSGRASSPGKRKKRENSPNEDGPSLHVQKQLHEALGIKQGSRQTSNVNSGRKRA